MLNTWKSRDLLWRKVGLWERVSGSMKVWFPCLGEGIALRTSPPQTLLCFQKPVLFRILPESGLCSLPSMSCASHSIPVLSREHYLYRTPWHQFPCQDLPLGNPVQDRSEKGLHFCDCAYGETCFKFIVSTVGLLWNVSLSTYLGAGSGWWRAVLKLLS